MTIKSKLLKNRNYHYMCIFVSLLLIQHNNKIRKVMNTFNYNENGKFPGIFRCKQHKFSKREKLPFNDCGSFCIPLDGISSFERELKIKAKEQKNHKTPLLDQVLEMKRQMHQNKELKLMFDMALSCIPEGGVLNGCLTEDFFYMINVICTEPPKFENTSFVGIPFAALFIDLMNSEWGQQLFSSAIVNQLLRKVFNAYTTMLSSPVSLKYITCDEPNGWLSPSASKSTNWDEYYIDKEDPHWGFKNFNDFFTRPIRPQARPIEAEAHSIIHSSDSSPLYFSSEKLGKNPFTNVQAQSNFWFKDNEYSLYEMFEAEQHGLKGMIDDHFVGGTVYQAILCPWYYHRWHAPISGTIIKSYRIGGKYFMLNPLLGLGGKHEGIENYVKSLPMLSMVSVRQVIIIEMNDNSGRLIALIQIGMTEVSSCCPSVVEGQKVKKGDQLGYFQYGGSSYAMIFDKNLELEFNSAIYVPNNKGMVDLQHVNSHLATFK